MRKNIFIVSDDMWNDKTIMYSIKFRQNIRYKIVFRQNIVTKIQINCAYDWKLEVKAFQLKGIIIHRLVQYHREQWPDEKKFKCPLWYGTKENDATGIID